MTTRQPRTATPASPATPASREPKTVIVYTDGACSGNPGPGGWAAVLRYGDHELELSGGEPDTTNNRMELQGVIEALRKLKRRCHVQIHTDSRYVADGIQSWIPKWKRNGWRTASGSEVKNRDLWEVLDHETQRHDIDWVWVKGHADNPMNERVDRLAVAASQAARNR